MDYKELIELLRNDSECNVLDYIEDAATAIEDLLAERRAAGWVSVKDRLPEPGIAVLVLITGGSEQLVRVGRYVDMSRWLVWGYGGVEITHWMPLPEPPEEGTP